MNSALPEEDLPLDAQVLSCLGIKTYWRRAIKLVVLLQMEVLDVWNTGSLLGELYPLSSLATYDIVGVSSPLLINV